MESECIIASRNVNIPSFFFVCLFSTCVFFFFGKNDWNSSGKITPIGFFFLLFSIQNLPVSIFITCSEFVTWEEKESLWGEAGEGVMRTTPIGFSKNGLACIIPV
jgi:hypothetical protein